MLSGNKTHSNSDKPLIHSQPSFGQVSSRKMLGESNSPRVANLPNPNKLSDFSIDHILNRAGKATTQPGPFYSTSGFRDFSKNFISNSSTSTPLNWLQYSRYHPPKLQSKDYTDL